MLKDETVVTCHSPLSGKLVYTNRDDGNITNTEFRKVIAGEELAYPWKTAKWLWFVADSKPNTLVRMYWWEGEKR